MSYWIEKFLQKKKDQKVVRIRDQRYELYDAESAFNHVLERLPGMADCLIVYKEKETGDIYLVSSSMYKSEQVSLLEIAKAIALKGVVNDDE